MSRIWIGLLVVLSLSGCWVSTRKGPVHRDLVWVQPGARPIFVALVRDQTKTRSMLSHEHDGGELYMKGSDEVTRETWIVAIDPVTGTSTRLSSARGYVAPILWDAARSVLWAERGSETVGFMKSGITILDEGEGTGGWFFRLPAPFALVRGERGTLVYNLRTSATVEIGIPGGWGPLSAQLDGSTLRISRVSEKEGQLQVEQVVTEWSSPRPFSVPSMLMQTPSLDPALGTRRAYGLSDNGRHLLEIVDLQQERRLVVYDILGGTPPQILTLPHETTLAPASAAEAAPPVHLETIDLDTYLLTQDTPPCRRGHFFSRASGRLLPTPPDLCIKQVATLEGSTLRLLQLQGADHFAYRTPDGRLIDLGEGVKHPIAIGTSAIAFSRRAGDHFEVVRLEMGTGTVRVVGSHPGVGHAAQRHGGAHRHAGGRPAAGDPADRRALGASHPDRAPHLARPLSYAAELRPPRRASAHSAHSARVPQVTKVTARSFSSKTMPTYMVPMRYKASASPSPSAGRRTAA
jgi:hypothetical protein